MLPGIGIGMAECNLDRWLGLALVVIWRACGVLFDFVASRASRWWNFLSEAIFWCTIWLCISWSLANLYFRLHIQSTTVSVSITKSGDLSKILVKLFVSSLYSTPVVSINHESFLEFSDAYLIVKWTCLWQSTCNFHSQRTCFLCWMCIQFWNWSWKNKKWTWLILSVTNNRCEWDLSECGWH